MWQNAGRMMMLLRFYEQLKRTRCDGKELWKKKNYGFVERGENKKSHLPLIIFLQVAWHVYLSFFKASHTALSRCLFRWCLMMLCTVVGLHARSSYFTALLMHLHFTTKYFWTLPSPWWSAWNTVFSCLVICRHELSTLKERCLAIPFFSACLLV